MRPTSAPAATSCPPFGRLAADAPVPLFHLAVHIPAGISAVVAGVRRHICPSAVPPRLPGPSLSRARNNLGTIHSCAPCRGLLPTQKLLPEADAGDDALCPSSACVDRPCTLHNGLERPRQITQAMVSRDARLVHRAATSFPTSQIFIFLRRHPSPFHAVAGTRPARRSSLKVLAIGKWPACIGDHRLHRSLAIGLHDDIGLTRTAPHSPRNAIN